jgi:hypothetical protein
MYLQVLLSIAELIPQGSLLSIMGVGVVFSMFFYEVFKKPKEAKEEYKEESEH